MEPKQFVAHYNCTCSKCGKRIARGQAVHYYNGHIVCSTWCFYAWVQQVDNARAAR